MRRSLWWMLGGTAALSLVALWVPAQPRVLAAAHTEAPSLPATPAGASPAAVAAPPAKRSLPASQKPVQLDAAKRDLFASEEPKPVAAAKPAAPAASTPPPPPAVSAPPMPYKVVGVMLDPDGRRLVILGKVDKSIIAAPGMQLDEGFLIEAVGDEAVQLLYPASDTRFHIPIPRPQS